ncbi:MAG: hypothetical protein ABWY94_06700 [Pseudoxanthomonas sp.]
MRTLTLVVIGLVFMAFAMWLTKPAQRITTAWLFTALWLLATSWNLYTGLSHGYSLQEELPIHIGIFAVPVVVAWALAWKGRGRRG